MNQSDLDILVYVFGEEHVIVVDEEHTKMKGTVAKLMAEKRFGFIRGQDGRDYFFHQSGFNGFFDDLAEDFARNPHIAVTFEVTPSDKGPRAENVSRIDGGITPTD